jgi:serine/threonine-protein kinase PpkA
MEFIDGGPLDERIRRYLSFNELLRLITDVANGLDFAHSKGYVHRDIKPGNILFRKSGEAVISDFGIAKALDNDSQMTKAGSVIGTPAYMSPEQASGLDLDSRSDLYSVAVMVYRILTGTVPYRGETSLSVAVQHVTEPIPTMPEALKEIQPFIDKGMAKKPDDRFANGKELVASLAECLKRVAPEDEDATKTEVLTLLAKAEYTPSPSGLRAPSSVSGTVPIKPVQVKSKTASLNLPVSPGRIAVAGVAAVAIAAAIWLVWPKGLSQADQARVELLLSNARSDINAGRYFKPAGNNAMHKFQRALELAPDYPATIAAMEKLAASFVLQSETALQREDLEEAQRHSEQALSLSPENKDVEQQLSKVAEAMRQRFAEQEAMMANARAAASQANWSEAARLYGELPVEELESNGVQSELGKHVRGLIADIELNAKNKDFEAADKIIGDAQGLTALIIDDEWPSQLRQAESTKREAKSEQERDRRIDELLAQAANAEDINDAVDFYLKVLQESPSNNEARDGIRKNADAVISNTAKSIARGRTSDARRVLPMLEGMRAQNGLTQSQSQLVSSLRRDLNAYDNAASVIDGLVSRFNRYMATPKVTDAHKIFRQILQTNANDRRVPGLRNQLAQGYLKVANSEAAAGDWSGARKAAEGGLEASPGHSALSAFARKAKANGGRKPWKNPFPDIFK